MFFDSLEHANYEMDDAQASHIAAGSLTWHDPFVLKLPRPFMLNHGVQRGSTFFLKRIGLSSTTHISSIGCLLVINSADEDIVRTSPNQRMLGHNPVPRGSASDHTAKCFQFGSQKLLTSKLA